jgi:hypothetical protein
MRRQGKLQTHSVTLAYLLLPRPSVSLMRTRSIYIKGPELFPESSFPSLSEAYSEMRSFP